MNTHKFFVCIFALAVAFQLQAIGQTGVSRILPPDGGRVHGCPRTGPGQCRLAGLGVATASLPWK